MDRYTDNSSTTSKGNAKTVTEIKDRVQNLENMMRAIITKVSEVHNAMNLGIDDRISARSGMNPNLLRSVSEFPGFAGTTPQYDQNGPALTLLSTCGYLSLPQKSIRRQSQSTHKRSDKGVSESKT